MKQEQLEGAVRMAQWWVRNPGRMTDAGFEQVCRELYTISVALAYLATTSSTPPERDSVEATRV